MENIFEPDCIRCHSGTYFNLRRPTVEMVKESDILHALERIPRWGGHTEKHYSVLSHSVWCYNRALEVYKDLTVAVKVFMHDFHEAYMGDIPSPVGKQLTFTDDLKERVQNVIHEHYGITISNVDQEIIHAVDREALFYEWDNLKLKWDPKHDFRYDSFKARTILEYWNKRAERGVVAVCDEA